MLLDDWSRYRTEWGYGAVVVTIVFWRILSRRKQWHAIPQNTERKGLLVVLAACLMLVAGRLSAELLSSRVSFFVLCAGLLLTFHGWPRLRSVLPELGVCLTAIPLPQIVYFALARPIQGVLCSLAVSLLDLGGFSMNWDGQSLHVPGVAINLNGACTPLRVIPAVAGVAAIQELPVRQKFLLAGIGAVFCLVYVVTRVASLAAVADVAPDNYNKLYNWTGPLTADIIGGVMILLAARRLRKA